MAASDSVLVYITSTLDLHFAMLVSKDDDISALKKKAEAQYLDLFPQKGTIIAQAIKVMRQEIMYYLPDSIPVRFLFDKAEETSLVFMDAVVGSHDHSLKSQDDLVSPSAPSRALTSQDDLDVLNRKGADNQVVSLDPALTSQDDLDVSNRKGGDNNQVMPREDENPIGQEEHVPKKQSQGEPSSLAPDAVNLEVGLTNIPLTELKDDDNVRERSQSKKSGRNRNKKSQEKSNVAENAGESASLPPKVINPEDGLMNTPLTEHKDEDEVSGRHRSKKSGGNKIKKSQDQSNVTTDSRVASDEQKKRARDLFGSGVEVSKGKKQKVPVSSEVVTDERRCQRNSGSGWRCPNEALLDMKFCYQHSSRNKAPKKTPESEDL